MIGCGRVGFDASVDAHADGLPASGSPDLLELLPDRVANLVGYWRMDGDWRDASPRGNDLVTLVGTPAFTTAAILASGGAFYDTSFELTNRPSLEVSYLSFSVWFKSDLINTANSNSGHTIFRISCATCGGDPEIDIAIHAAVRNSGMIEFFGSNLPDGSAIANQWHHLVGVYEPNGRRIYLDGQLAREDAAANPPLQTAGGILWVGQLWPNRAPLYNPQHLHGAMDELAIWNTSLSAAEAEAIYTNQRP